MECLFVRETVADELDKQLTVEENKIKLWSRISDNVQSTDSVNMFKKRLVKLSLSNQEPDSK